MKLAKKYLVKLVKTNICNWTDKAEEHGYNNEWDKNYSALGRILVQNNSVTQRLIYI